MKLKAGGIIEWYAGALLELFGKGGRWSNTSKKKKPEAARPILVT